MEDREISSRFFFLSQCCRQVFFCLEADTGYFSVKTHNLHIFMFEVTRFSGIMI